MTEEPKPPEPTDWFDAFLLAAAKAFGTGAGWIAAISLALYLAETHGK